MAKELVTMSRTEIDRMGVIRMVLEGRLSQGKAGELLGLGARQVRRLATAYELKGPASCPETYPLHGPRTADLKGRRADWGYDKGRADDGLRTARMVPVPATLRSWVGR